MELNKNNKTMNLEEVKDKVAQRHGWADWDNIENSDIYLFEAHEIHSDLLNEVAREYAKAKLDKLIENLPTDRDIERRGREGGQDMRRIIKEKINNIKLD